MITIKKAPVIRQGDSVRLQAVLKSPAGEETLWYSFEERFLEGTVKDRLDAFLVGALLAGMRKGEDIAVEGPVSETLFFNLTRHVIPILVLNNPMLKPVHVHCEEFLTEKDRGSGQGVVTGFSGGVDSLCTIYDHLIEDCPESFRLTHMMFNNVGAHGDSEPGRKLFQARFELLRDYPSKFGLDLVKVDSNLGDVLWGQSFQQTHIMRNVSAVLLFQNLFRRFYYASSIHYRDASFGARRDMCGVESALLPLLSTETLDVMLTGGQHTRVEKTRRIILVPDAEKILNVCVSAPPDGRNCSKCKKCRRTMMTLELHGELQRFNEVFDLEAWRRNRTAYVIGTMFRRPRRYLIKEMVVYIKEKKIHFPLWQRLLGKALGVFPDPNDIWVRNIWLGNLRPKLGRLKRAILKRKK